jgi:DNA-binding transcriptional regulator YiaG
MTKKPSAFEARLLRAMRQAAAISTGKRPPARAYALPMTARDAAAVPAPDVSAEDVIDLRRRLGLSQPVFASALNVSAATARSWEQGVKPPSGPAKRLLQVAKRHPAIILEFVQERVSERASRSAVREPVKPTYAAAKRGLKKRTRPSRPAPR